MELHLERIRRAEIESLRSWFKPGMDVLEIGGGSGFQAKIMADWGCRVVSIDVDSKPSPEHQFFGKQYYPVQTYDGIHIPWPDRSFDLVYSSNVLYHVRPPNPLVSEIYRVLRGDGLSIHLLPTVSWRFWTNVAHYVFMFRRVGKRLRRHAAAVSSAPSTPPATAAPAISRGKRLKDFLRPSPLGPYSSALAELYYFRRGYWRGIFDGEGFEVVEARGQGLFHTGYMLAPELPMSMRHTLARFAGSASTVFVLRPVQGA